MIVERPNNKILIYKKPFKVIICLVTCVAFFVNIFAYDLAWAEKKYYRDPPPIVLIALSKNCV